MSVKRTLDISNSRDRFKTRSEHSTLAFAAGLKRSEKPVRQHALVMRNLAVVPTVQ